MIFRGGIVRHHNNNNLAFYDKFFLVCRLQWNPSAKRMENVPGVFTRCPGFGNTSGIEWLDPSVHGPGVYFYPLVDSLCRLYGYKRGTTIRSAPYDFRYDPGEFSLAVEDLTTTFCYYDGE